MLNPIDSQDLAVLRSLAARGDKTAEVVVRIFDSLRGTDKDTVRVRAATTANRTLSGLTNTVLDGVTPVADDLILVKSQTDAKANGIYVAHSGAWTRLKDDQGDDVLTPGMIVYINEGTTLQDTLWSLTSNTTVVGTDDITYAQMLASVAAAGSLTPAQSNSASYFVKEEDFPLAASGTLPAPLAKDVQGDATGDYLNDTSGGVYSLATAVTSEAEAAQLTYGDQLIIDPSVGPVFEARVRVNIPGGTPSADERWVVGLCSAHTNAEDVLDDVTYNAWFRGEGANLDLLAETDDGATDDDDNDTTVNWADNTWMLLKIDMTTLASTKFYVNGTLRATLDLTALDGTKLLQPIFCYQRDAGTEINKLEVDWYRVYQGRA